MSPIAKNRSRGTRHTTGKWHAICRRPQQTRKINRKTFSAVTKVIQNSHRCSLFLLVFCWVCLEKDKLTDGERLRKIICLDPNGETLASGVENFANNQKKLNQLKAQLAPSSAILARNANHSNKCAPHTYHFLNKGFSFDLQKR